MTNINVSHLDHVAVIELNRPEKLNALDEPTRTTLLDALTAAAADSQVSTVVLTGAGRAFCVGQDLAAVHELDDTHDTVARTYNPLTRAIVSMNKPVIAAVNGPAVGAGMALALACDLILMAEAASFSCAFAKMALVPDTGASWFLARSLGRARAFELSVSGRKVLAAEALRLGLVNQVVSETDLMPSALKLAADLAAGPGQAYAMTKRLLVDAADLPLDVILEHEAFNQGLAAAGVEHQTRRAAFLQKTAK
jgi:2-(1,2-epoxy-1,2-dihydrophenyl)acetyl-CoA isomerase